MRKIARFLRQEWMGLLGVLLVAAGAILLAVVH